MTSYLCSWCHTNGPWGTCATCGHHCGLSRLHCTCAGCSAARTIGDIERHPHTGTDGAGRVWDE